MDLLDEIWVLIFRRYLDGIDTMRCRQVSKRFNFLIDQFCLTELLVCDYHSTCYDVHSVDREPGLWIQLFEFNLKPNSSFQAVFAERLKFLQMNIKLTREFNLEILNEFVCLEKLNLMRVIISRTQTLKLPKLTTFSIRLYTEREYKYHSRPINYDREPRLVLDSKVKNLFSAYQKVFVIKHPECIEVLDCEREMESEKLVLLKNLRILQHNLSESLLNAFETLEKLEELHLDTFIRNENALEKQRLMNELMRKRFELKRKVNVYLLEVSWPFEQLLTEPRLGVRIKNYHKLSVCTQYIVHYSVLVKNLDQQREHLTRNGIALNEKGFPVCFFEKHRNIRRVNAYETESVEEDRFLWFLSQCARLQELLIDFGLLSQSLLNRIPMVCSHLKFLILCTNGKAKLDLSPIYKLKHLFILQIGSEQFAWSLDLGLLFEKCRHLASVRLRYIRIAKRKLYFVYIFGRSDLMNPTVRLDISRWQKRGPYKYEELKSVLDKFVEESKEALEIRNNKTKTRSG